MSTAGIEHRAALAGPVGRARDLPVDAVDDRGDVEEDPAEDQSAGSGLEEGDEHEQAHRRGDDGEVPGPDPLDVEQDGREALGDRAG